MSDLSQKNELTEKQPTLGDRKESKEMVEGL